MGLSVLRGRAGLSPADDAVYVPIMQSQAHNASGAVQAQELLEIPEVLTLFVEFRRAFRPAAYPALSGPAERMSDSIEEPLGVHVEVDGAGCGAGTSAGWVETLDS